MRKRTTAALTAEIEDLRNQLYAERGHHLREVKLLQDDIANNRIAHEEITRELREEIREIKTNTLTPQTDKDPPYLEVAPGLSNQAIGQKVDATPDVVELVRRSISGKLMD
jgi:hypothetical protein